MSEARTRLPLSLPVIIIAEDPQRRTSVSQFSRRSFLGASLTAAAARAAQTAPSDRIRVGLIAAEASPPATSPLPRACRRRNPRHLRRGRRPHRHHRQPHRKMRGKAPAAVKDFRRVVERNDIDACLICTPDHWHALPTIAAFQAGKDVYVEKPLATSIGEGRACATPPPATIASRRWARTGAAAIIGARPWR